MAEIVTARLLTDAAKLDLPKASSTADIQKPQKIEFVIDADRQLYWNGDRLSRRTRWRNFVEAGQKRAQPGV